MTHSKLPWKVTYSKAKKRIFIESNNQFDIIVQMLNGEVANAEFIIKACNNHDKLIEMVRKFIHYCPQPSIITDEATDLLRGLK